MNKTYNSKYEIASEYIGAKGYKWTPTGNGEYIVGLYKGTKYFIKRYTMGPRVPRKSIPEPVYSEQLDAANCLMEKQNDIRKRLEGLSVDKDHIVKEEENFWDSDNIFTTVTRLIPDENKDKDCTSLDFASFGKLCVDITELVRKIHNAGVTHGDLKEKNILIQKKGRDYIPYLIDFDSSYPTSYSTEKRKDGHVKLPYPVVFSEGYQSPEIAIYNFEDEGVVDPSTITEKTDIFTLAVIFHKLWTNSFPAVVGDCCAVGEAVYLDTPVKVDPKFDVVLGSSNNCRFSSLLYWMMAKDKDVRPTAAEVLDALQDRINIRERYESPEDILMYQLEPWKLHESYLEILSKEELKEKDVAGFERITDGGKYKYLVTLMNGKEKRLNVEEVISNGYGRKKSATSVELWEEDSNRVEFISADALSEKGVLSVEKKEICSRKFYFVTMLSGNTFTTGCKGLVDYGYAVYKIRKADEEFEITDKDSPWPEHGSGYDKTALMNRNIIKVERVTENDEKKYLITIKDEKGKKQNIVKVSYMKIMKFIV